MNFKIILEIFIGLKLIFSSLSFSQTGWLKIPFEYSTNSDIKILKDIKFTDALHGWVFGRGGIYNTEDGGETWSIKYKFKYDFKSDFHPLIAYTNFDTCFVIKEDTLYKTVDNGASWTPIYVQGLYRYLEAAYFVNSNLGWGIGEEYVENNYLSIFKTTDGGKTWNSKYSELKQFWNQLFFSIDFPSAKKGFVVGYWGNFYMTNDSGETWTKNKINDGSLYSINFVDTLLGWAVGYNGAVLVTNNGGVSWNHQNSGVNSTLRSIFFTNSYHGIAVGNSGTIIYTTDGGENWFDNSPNTLMDFYAVDFINNSIGWVVGGKEGDSSVVYKTYSGGLVSIKDEYPSLYDKFILYQNYPNPFNPTTTIKYSIPPVETQNIASVLLKVYDILGREVAILVNEKQKPGIYKVEFNAQSAVGGLPSGVYFYQLKANSKKKDAEVFIQARKMLLIK